MKSLQTYFYSSIKNIKSLSWLQVFMISSVVLGLTLLVIHPAWALDVNNEAANPATTPPASSAGILTPVAQGLAAIFYLLFIYIPGWILALVSGVMVWVLSYQGFAQEAIITKGWTVLRDLSNSFFILVLVVVAIGTIVKSGRYGYQQNLRRLILMAILINFSKTITLFFIDLSQAVTLTFVNSFLDAIQGGFPKLLGLTGWMTLWSGTDFPQVNILTVLLQIGLGGIMLLVTLVVVSVITFLFLMRIIMFAFIIILSPVAFLCSTLPTASKYYLEWWDNLSKYLVLGPTLAFFLWLSFAVVHDGGTGVLSSTISDDGSTSSVTIQGEANSAATPTTTSNSQASKSLTRFFVAISLLFGSLMMAGKLGTVGAGISKQAAGKLTGIGKSVLVGRSGAGGLLGTGRSLAAIPIGGVANGLDRLNQMTNSVTGRIAGNIQTGVTRVTGNEKMGRFAGDVTRTVAKGTVQVMGGAALNPYHRAAREFARNDSASKAKDIKAKQDEMKYDPEQTRLNSLDDADRNKAAAAAASLRADGAFKNGKNTKYIAAASEAFASAGSLMEEDLEKFEVENLIHIKDKATRDKVVARAVAKGEEEKLISNIHVKTFTGKDFTDDMRKELFADLNSAGVSADTLEKGAKRWGKEDQKIFAGAYADAFANDPDQSVRQRSLSMFARLDPGGLMEYVNNPRNSTKENVKGGFAGNDGLKNAVTSMAAEQIVKMKDDHLKEIAPYLSAAQIKTVGEKATDGQAKIIVRALEADPNRDIRAVKHIMTADSFSKAVADVKPVAVDKAFQENQKKKQEYENDLGKYRQHAIEQGIKDYKKWKKADKAAVKAGTKRPDEPKPPVVPPNIN